MLPISPHGSQKVPPIASIEPQAIKQNDSHMAGSSSAFEQNLSHLNLWTSTLMLSFLQILSILW